MSRPAGVELKRWFTYMVVLLVVVNVAAVAGAIVTKVMVSGVISDYQPFLAATTRIERKMVSAQRDMFEYLSELADKPDAALKNLAELKEEIRIASELAPTEDARKKLEEIKGLTAQYSAAIEQLPGAIAEGTRDWGRLDTIRKTAIRYGGEASTKASELADWARAEITKRGDFTSTMTNLAMYGLIGLLLASGWVLVSLRHWWTKFQDMMLGL